MFLSLQLGRVARLPSPATIKCFHSKSVPKFRGIYLPKQRACLNMRVLPAKFREMTNNYSNNGSNNSAGDSLMLAKQGAIVLDFAPATSTNEKRNYDWVNKSTIFLSASDILHLSYVNIVEGQELKIDKSYNTNDGAKFVRTLIIRNNGIKTGFTVTCVSNTTGNGPNMSSSGNTVSIPLDLNTHEYLLWKHQLNVSVPYITGWQYNLDPTLFIHDQHIATAGAGNDGMPEMQ